MPGSSPLPSRPIAPPSAPWWRHGIMWLVVGGPVVAVVFSIAAGAAAWYHADEELHDATAADEPVAVHAAQPTAPAMQARNHAATPHP
jgi:hypothetical protein